MIDEETKKIITEQEQMKMMIESEAWVLAKKFLGDKLSNFTSIQTLDIERKSDEVVAEIGNRIAVTKIIWDWIKQVEGVAGMADNSQNLQDEEDLDIYKRSS